jgi:hypothetical protein
MSNSGTEVVVAGPRVQEMGNDFAKMADQFKALIGDGSNVENFFVVVQTKDGNVETMAELDYPIVLTMMLVKQAMQELFNAKQSRAIESGPQDC